MIKFIKKISKLLKQNPQNTLNRNRVMIGKLLSEQLKKNQISDSEFSCYSQFGEDGIIQYLINNLDIKNKTFIEFGVENYEESNTRFLLENNNWKGLIIDSSAKNTNFIKSQEYYWKRSLKVSNNFIDRENINNIFLENDFSGEIGLLSIDIDGNDYWVWEAINIVKPEILIIEYNARFGKDLSVSIPYNKDFVRSNIYPEKVIYGASIKALNKLSLKKGYELVYINSNGNNAFFVNRSKLNENIKRVDINNIFNKNSFSENVRENKILPETPLELDQLIQQKKIITI